MGISSLPVELLEHVVRNSVEPGDLPWSYTARYSTLRALGLVCRRWRDVAQCVLHESVLAPDDVALELVARTLRDRVDLARRVKRLDVHSSRPHSSPVLPALHSALDLVRNVEELFLGRPGEIDIASLWSLPKLRELSIYAAKLTNSLEPASASTSSPSSDNPHHVAPHLSHLSLCGVHVDAAAVGHLSAATLPRLRVIAHAFSPSRLRLDDFPSSLRTVSNVPLRDHRPGTDETTLYWSRFEVEPDLGLLGLDDLDDRTGRDRVHHLRLTDAYGRDLVRHFIAWVEALPKLATLFVTAAELSPDGDDSQLASLRAFCDGRRVALVVEGPHDDDHDWSSVVPLAWR
ncbi:hypothetical protein JCM3775_006527 [Rhodotorula graminis]